MADDSGLLSAVNTEYAGGSAGRVAVVITTYNHARFLGSALDSVLAQTRPADEIVVVDDGSTDDPGAVVAAYAGVKCLSQPNRGLSAARNLGLASVTSHYVVFLDADDRLLPHALGAGLTCFEGAPAAGFVYGGWRQIDGGGAVRGDDQYDPAGANGFGAFLRCNPIGMHAAVMYKREILVAAGGFDESLPRCEDYDAYLKLSRTCSVASYPTIVAEYRWHGGNMSANHRSMLEWALRVQAKYSTALPPSERRQSASVWRDYYAEEMLVDAEYVSSPVAFARQVGRAVATSPGVALRRLGGTTRRRLKRSARLQSLRRWARLHAPAPLGNVKWGDLGNATPVAANFGFSRGTPVDRYYIERFLLAHASDIQGRVLEIGDAAYSRRFGAARVAVQDVLHVEKGFPGATLYGDISCAGVLPEGAFDCMILTQTMHLLYDMRPAVRELERALRPGGVLLVTVPGVSSVDRGKWRDHWCWSLTATSARTLFRERFDSTNLQVRAHGNVYAATAFLQGLAVEEVDRAKLEVEDAAYPVLVTVRAQKGRGV